MEILCQQSQIIKKQDQNITHSNQWKQHNTKDPRTWSNKNLVVSSEISSLTLQEIYSAKIVEILILDRKFIYKIMKIGNHCILIVFFTYFRPLR